MPTVRPVDPPARETYVKVFRRYDRLASTPIKFVTYNLNLTARPCEMHGVVACTLFLPAGKDSSVIRAVRTGWKDETELWQMHLNGDKPDPKKPQPIGKKPDIVPVQESKIAMDAPGVPQFDSGIAPVKRRAQPVVARR